MIHFKCKCLHRPTNEDVSMKQCVSTLVDGMIQDRNKEVLKQVNSGFIVFGYSIAYYEDTAYFKLLTLPEKTFSAIEDGLGSKEDAIKAVYTFMPVDVCGYYTPFFADKDTIVNKVL